MKKGKKISLLFVVLIMMLLFAVSASALDTTGQCGKNVYWSFDETTGDLVISGEGEMYGYYIDYSPFIATDIKNIIIEEGVTTIGYKAFMQCDYVETVVIPSSLTSIGDYAFLNCRSISCFDVDANNNEFSNDDAGVLFNKNKSVLIECPRYANLSSYTIPNTVTTINEKAFMFCNNLTKLIIPDNVTDIGESAFCGCKNLKSVAIGNGVTTVSKETFYYCTALTEVTFSDSVVAIEAKSFRDCDSLATISLPENLLKIDSGAFYSCNSLKNIKIPDSVTNIESEAFGSCSSLVSFSVGDNNKEYSNDDQGVLFNKNKDTLIHCPAGYPQTTYTIPNSVTTIEAYAFYENFNNLTSVTIPTSVKSIKEFAFDDLQLIYEGNEAQWEEIDISCYNFFTNVLCLGEEKIDTSTESEKTEEDEKIEEDEKSDVTLDSKEDCSCSCHKKGISNFLWKIGNFFSKLFKIKSKQFCSCGVAHY